MRVLVALSGNAMTAPDGSARPADQIAAVSLAATRIAELVGAGVQVVLTHGNGPQVGNLLVKNELAASVVPPVPLDWCDAQTQGTIGFILLNALESALPGRRAAALVTRVLVDAADPAFARPTKPIGRYLPAEQAAVLVAHGEHWEDRGARGWRRVVASPEPVEILDAPAASALVDAGYLVVAAGGGGIPVVRDEDGRLRGVEAVVDKDLSAALLARAVGADVLVIATDVEAVQLGFGTDHAHPLARATPQQLRALAAGGEFATGSMAPKVEAAARFVVAGGRYAVIASLDRIAEAAGGRAGTLVVPDANPPDPPDANPPDPLDANPPDPPEADPTGRRP